METWRQHDFREGASYKVKKSFSTVTSRFREGELLIFIGSCYSPYDASSGFMFTGEGTEQIKTWFLHDSAEDRSADLFEKEKRVSQ
jgi:hypothetical protein